MWSVAGLALAIGFVRVVAQKRRDLAHEVSEVHGWPRCASVLRIVKIAGETAPLSWATTAG
jgi:hypothetical protein